MEDVKEFFDYFIIIEKRKKMKKVAIVIVKLIEILFGVVVK